MSYPQNGDCIVTIDSVTSPRHVYRQSHIHNSRTVISRIDDFVRTEQHF